MTGDTNRPRPPCAGYLRRLDGVDEQEELRLVAAMADFAERAGLALTLVAVEKRPGYVEALHAVTRYCRNHGVRNVVVPTYEHLNQLPPLAHLAKELLQQDIGGLVWIAASAGEEASSCPLTTRNGGTT